MGKILEPKDLEQPNHLASVEAPIRAEVLRELPQKDREQVMENLIESAMTMGLTDGYQIRQWLGMRNLDIRKISNTRDRVKKRWLEETENVFEYAKTQRAMQIQKALQEVRECEKLYKEAIGTRDKVSVKKLQLEWMLYISKLSFVEKMVEASQPDMQIIVNGGLSMEGGDDGERD